MAHYDPRVIDAHRLHGQASGYGTTVPGGQARLDDVTTDDYAAEQMAMNAQKAVDFVLPMIREQGAQTVLDVGCGVGRMVTTLQGLGLDAYGVDLTGLQGRWRHLGVPTDRFFLVGPDRLQLPFQDASLDFAFTLGAIEHVGTSDGNADRLPDYHARREQWTREIFRTIKVGGSLLLAGPNRNFPVDVAHGLDSQSNRIERWLSAKAGASIHRTWGESFLWGYSDVHRYLAGFGYEVRPVSVRHYLHYSRVPSLLRPMVRAYLNHLPRPLLGTGFNPWMAALVKRTA
jgi:SAM-dependent methyltransferase